MRMNCVSNTDTAIKALELLTDRSPDDAAAHHNLGVLYSSNGQCELAAKHFRTSLHLRPDASHTQAELARLTPVEPDLSPKAAT